MKIATEKVTKRFGDLVANDEVSIEFGAGAIHALLGENGAGKSTYMAMLYGMLEPDEGTILFDGKPVELSGPPDAMAAGIGMVFQHFMLVGPFTVAQNVLLGLEPAELTGVDEEAMNARVAELADRYGIQIDPRARVDELSVGLQQRVEILKALARDVRVLILDEPTSVLGPEDAQALFVVMRKLAAEGKTILFVTHRLNEVRQVASTVTVMRHGRVVGTCDPSADRDEIVALMLGESKPLSLTYAPPPRRGKTEVLRIRDLHAAATLGSGLRGLELSVRPGEIVGVAGVEGNGQRELLRSLIGLTRPEHGTISIDGHDVTDAPPAERTRLGLGFIADDRHGLGMIGGLSVSENLILTRQRRFTKHGLLDFKSIDSDVAARIREFDVRLSSPQQLIGRLSGGNQQKVVIARELARELKILVAAQPTRGVDAGAAHNIHSQIVALRDRGVGVLLLSAELDEVLSLSDRVVVLAGGVAAPAAARPWDRQAIGAAMSHEHPEAVRGSHDG
ncbi:ABC transporter ATP-binding protein [Amycolatopsis pithecellobii]|uniref:ABC transporter ATP-binding protein n=1 Tax=Amycolatopsis pithecellobii TaxID=664692 RepID=UPI0012B93FA4|nr:ABC transporter ATP-binding protein [Amycolatopsis pithecellobii]